MVKKKGTKEQLVDENEEETQQKGLILLSSDDDEANEDLSLQIVEKARLREAKRNRDERDGNDDGLGVIDLSSSSCEEVKRFSDRSESSGKEIEDVKKVRKRNRKKSKSKKIEEEEEKDKDDKFVGVIETEEGIETITSVETELVCDVDTEELSDKCVEGEAVVIPDNIVLRKLLRGARYFDPPSRSCRTCYNCGEEGHNAVDCTSKRRKKPCFICGSFEHGVRNCTQGQDCFICKKQGHRAKDCPEKHQVNSQDTKICLRCGDLGHLMSSCSNDYDPKDVKEIECYVCKRPGHLCCVDPINPGLVEVSCYNCGQSGHTGSGCAKQRGELSDTFAATLCYKCGEEGHFARGCTNNSKRDRWMSESSTPKRKYLKKGKESLGFRSAPLDLNKVPKKKSAKFEEKETEGKSKRRGGWITDDPGHLPNRKTKNSGRSPVTPSQNGNENEERDIATEGRSKGRGGWITDDPGDFPHRKTKNNGWKSPATSNQNLYKNPARASGESPANYQPRWRNSNHNHRTPSSHGSSPYPMSPTYGSPYPHYPMTPTYGSAPYPMTPSSHGILNPHNNMYTPSRFGNSTGSGDRRNYW